MRLLFLVLLYLFPQFLSGQNIDQRRSAFWVVRDALTTRSDIDKIISTAVDLRISDIFLQIRALGYTYYNSQWEPKSVKLKNDFDPLSYTLQRSRNTGIRIHAWVNMFYIWANQKSPADNNHIFNRRTDYVLRNGVFPDYKSLRSKGHEGFFLDPKAPVVQNDLLEILKEITASYDIAGIHLDYYRYPDLAHSFTPASRTLFMKDEIYDPWQIYSSANSYSEERGYRVFLHADRIYRRSLTTALSNYLLDISKDIKAIKPNIELSVAVKPDPVQAKHRYFQDWVTWIENSYCDFVVMMNYRTDWGEFETILKQLENRDLKKKIIVGISTYNQNVRAVLSRLEAVKAGSFAGFSLFSYNYLQKSKKYLNSILVNRRQ